MITAKEASKIAKKNDKNSHISMLIRSYAQSGKKEVDIGWFGHDSKVILDSKTVRSLQKNGYKVDERRNSHGLLLAHIISW